MPNFAVDSEESAQTSAGVINDFSQLQDKLTEVHSKIQRLLANGYATPAARQKFQPSFEEFARSFEQINQSLEGIGAYSRSGGEAFADTDAQLGNAPG
ncbi:WXG100 family type VII secretion target [Promicromonospora sukumoe]|uniref:WXG100 family type VII secretion target n=1 Tax=Promicromonospora sukumoe TaxID=88382 RepID=UPI0037C9C363